MKIFRDVVKFYNQHGEAVVFNNSKPIYIYGAIVNEVIEYSIEEEYKTYGKGKLIDVIEKSECRVNHGIKNADLIGGYDLIHMNYEEQKRFKIEKVKNDFKKIAGFEIQKYQWYEPQKKIKYRNKITVHDGFFFEKKTNKKIEIEDFLLSEIKWDRNRKGEIIYRQLETLISGTKKEKQYTYDNLCGFRFRVGLNSFYQINKEVTEFAYSFINDNIINNGNVLDLYCGIGTIGIIVSKNSKKVIGIEINKDSYEDALFNKELNKLNNIEFINSSVEKYLLQNSEKFDTLILDPSRKGVGKKVIKMINDAIKPKRIIYMSCNPATQAYDFSIMKNQYSISKFIIMDMFPQTYHIESIIVLDREK